MGKNQNKKIQCNIYVEKCTHICMTTYKTHGTCISTLKSDDLMQAIQNPPPTSESFLTTNPAYPICPNAFPSPKSQPPFSQLTHTYFTQSPLYLQSAANPPFLFKSQISNIQQNHSKTNKIQTFTHIKSEKQVKTHKDSHQGKPFTAANPQRISLKPASGTTAKVCTNKGFGFVVLVNPLLAVPCAYFLHLTLRNDCCCGKEKVKMLFGG